MSKQRDPYRRKKNLFPFVTAKEEGPPVFSKTGGPSECVRCGVPLGKDNFVFFGEHKVCWDLQACYRRQKRIHEMTA